MTPTVHFTFSIDKNRVLTVKFDPRGFCNTLAFNRRIMLPVGDHEHADVLGGMVNCDEIICVVRYLADRCFFGNL